MPMKTLVTYDDYNDDMEKSKALQEQVKVLEEYIGAYNTVKGSLIEEIEPGGSDEPEPDFSGIEFFGENAIKIYNIDSTYIDRLLETTQLIIKISVKKSKKLCRN